MSWTADDARALASRIFAASKARECELAMRLADDGHARFAAGEITTAGSSRTLSIAITSRDGGRSGSTTLDELDDGAIARAVARSEALMASAIPDPEQEEGLGPQDYPTIAAAYDERTAAAGPELRRDGVKAALDRARAGGLDASGFFENGAAWSAVANKKGNFGFHRSTSAAYSTTMRTPDGTGSGYAAADAPRLADFDPAALVERSATKAEASRKPRDLEPGRYTVILEPEAVADLLGGLGFALNARAADEGRSFFSKPGGGTLVGETLFAPGVTLRSDPFDPRNPGRPWTGGGGGGGGLGFNGFGGGGGGGLPSRKSTWIEGGALKALAVDRYWARKTGVEPLPFSGGLVMEGSDRTLDQLIADTERALLVTRFWYIRATNPRTTAVTGLTRDGVWLVEKGKVVHPVNNFRFNDSPANLLKNLDATSRSVAAGSMIVPAIRARDFLFSSRSDAV